MASQKSKMEKIISRSRSMIVNCAIGVVGSAAMAVCTAQAADYGIKCIKDGKILKGTTAISAATFLGIPLTVRNLLAQRVHLSREARLTSIQLNQIVRDETADPKDRERAKFYVDSFMEETKEGAGEEGAPLDSFCDPDSKTRDDDWDEDSDDTPDRVAGTIDFVNPIGNDVAPERLQNLQFITYAYYDRHQDFATSWDTRVLRSLIEKKDTHLFTRGYISGINLYFPNHDDVFEIFGLLNKNPGTLIVSEALINARHTEDSQICNFIVNDEKMPKIITPVSTHPWLTEDEFVELCELTPEKIDSYEEYMYYFNLASGFLSTSADSNILVVRAEVDSKSDKYLHVSISRYWDPISFKDSPLMTLLAHVNAVLSSPRLEVYVKEGFLEA